MQFQSYKVAQIGMQKCFVYKIADYISYTFAHTFLIRICPSNTHIYKSKGCSQIKEKINECLEFFFFLDYSICSSCLSECLTNLTACDALGIKILVVCSREKLKILI